MKDTSVLCMEKIKLKLQKNSVMSRFIYGEEVMIFLPHQLIMKIHHTQDLILSMMELMNCHLEKA